MASAQHHWGRLINILGRTAIALELVAWLFYMGDLLTLQLNSAEE